MKWHNLKRNMCPRCSKTLGFNENDEMLFCEDLKCGFQISQYRMERLTIQMSKSAYTPRDNFSDLQNLGNEMTENNDDETVDS